MCLRCVTGATYRASAASQMMTMAAMRTMSTLSFESRTRFVPCLRLSVVTACSELAPPRGSQTGDCAAIVTTAVTRCKANTSACYFDVDSHSSSLVLAISDHKTDVSDRDVTRAFLCRLTAPEALPWAAASSDAHTRQFKVTHVEMTGRGPAVAVCVLPPPEVVSDRAAHCSDCAMVATSDGAVSVFSVNTGELLAVLHCVEGSEIGSMVTASSTADVPAGGSIAKHVAMGAAAPRADDAVPVGPGGSAPVTGGVAPVAGGAAPVAGLVAPVTGSAAPTSGLASMELQDVAKNSGGTPRIAKGILRCDGTCVVLAFAQGDACVTQFYDVTHVGTHATATAVMPRNATISCDRFGELAALGVKLSGFLEREVFPTDVVLTRTNSFVSFSNGVIRWFRRRESGPVVMVCRQLRLFCAHVD